MTSKTRLKMLWTGTSLLVATLAGAQVALNCEDDHELLPFFPSVSMYEADGWQGFVRLVNFGPWEYVTVVARDDAGDVSETDVWVPGRSTVHFNNHDLEEGNPSKDIHYGGISGTTDGMWNLCIQSQNVQATGYVRTSDGFLMEATLPVQGHNEKPCFTSSHGAALCTKWVIPIFNPGYNGEQVSMLKLLNNTAVAKAVEIRGLRSDGTRNMDDDGEALRVLFTLKSSQGVYLTSEELESGGNYLDGKLTPIVNNKMVALPLGSIGRARGKWLIEIWAKADAPQEVVVMNLLHAKPTGHIANLSANADDAVTRRKDYDERD